LAQRQLKKNTSNIFSTFTVLKNITVIFLISIYLFSATELHQLFKLPLLLEHFSEHKQKDNSLSLYKFLTMHYATNDDNDGDKDKDMKLPFKSNDECANSINIAFTPTNLILTLKPIFLINKSFNIYNDYFSPTSVLSSIWQPPRA